MFRHIFNFEIKYRIKRPATWAYFGILFVFGVLVGIYGDTPSSEKVYANSPYAIGLMLIIISIFGTLIASAVMGVPIYRDIEHQVKDYFFTYPISEKQYLLGRYFGSLAILLLISIGFQLGLMVGFGLGPSAGLEQPERFGPFNLWYYVQPTLAYYWTNFLLTGTIFFALVVFTRKIFATYVGSVLFFIAYLLGNALTQDLEQRDLVDMLDPFAFNTYINATRYWTPVEQNELVATMTGHLFWNRVLWLGIALVIFLVTIFRFEFSKFFEERSSRKKAKKEETVALRPSAISLASIGKVQKVFSNGLYFRQMWSLAKLEFKNIIRDRYFLAMMLGGVLFLFLDGWFGNPIYGTPSLPTTYYMLEAKDFNYILFVFIILIFYTGEVVHRDRSVQYNGIADALPVPNWMVYGSKFLALVGISFLLVNIVIVCGVLNQTLAGYFHFEFDKYFTDLYLIEFPEYLQLTMLAFFVHIIVNQKFLGHVVTIGIWLAMFGFRDLAEYDYNLFFYSYIPGYLISDMNGFGHFAQPLFWFNLYWLSFGALLLIIGNLYWSRGSDSGIRSRWRIATSRLNGISTIGLVSALAIWIGAGAFIYYNVSVLNKYRTSKAQTQLQVKYEKQYSKYARIIQPKVTDVKLEADIFAKERRTVANGKFTIVNKSDVPIDSLHLNFGSPIYHTLLKKFTIDGQEPQRIWNDEVQRYSIYRFPGGAMAPGDTMLMEMTLEAGYKGFTNSGYNSGIVENGTFLNLSIFPSFGYDAGREITSDKDRKKYELPEKDYNSPPQDDAWGLSHLLFNDDADYVTFEAVLSTEPDQIALSPGYLQNEWEKDGRKYYHYKMDSEMDLFFNMSSARYAVHRDTWTNPDGSKGNIEIFHHPTHKRNVERFAKAVRNSMEYFNKFFTPYQYRQMRILEFPRYATFAQSFPNTVPYAESFGWVGDFSDPNEIDYSYTVTAHEVAHQWWGHQITPSSTRGANQISESMAEYSSLMVMKKEYGVEAMQKFLKYELDSYLNGRANESKFEKTLLDNDTQAYVWYRKGGLVLYALQDYIGEDSLNAGFRRFLEDAAFRQKPPYANTTEWYSYIQSVTPDSLKYFLEDSFEKIALYENRTQKATAKKLGDGKYEVTLEIDTKKIYYDGLGKVLGEGDQPNLIEIGIFTKDGKNDKGMTRKVPLYLQKQWLKPGQQTLKFTVEGELVKAGIDPYNKLIDRIPDDNLINVDIK